MVRIMGLDLSIAATGVCLPDGGTYTIIGKADDKDHRLVIIRDRISQDITDHGVDVAVIEDLPTHAHGAGITGMVHGAVKTMLMDLGVPYVRVTAATLKKFATGKGNANKTAMILAAFKRGNREFTDDNQCDAWWLWIAGLTQLTGLTPAGLLPAAQREVLSVPDWSPAGPAVRAARGREKAVRPTMTHTPGYAVLCPMCAGRGHAVCV